MEVRRIILPAIGLLVLLLIVVLYIKVNGSSAASVDPEALESAKKEHRRAEERAIIASSNAAPASGRSGASRSMPSPVKAEIAEPADHPDPAALSSPLRVMPRPGNVLGARDAEGGNELRDSLKEVRELYDRGRYPEAREAALGVLKEHPKNRRMLRVVISASCIMFEPDPAKEYFSQLPDRDKRTMRKRCAKYGVEDLD